LARYSELVQAGREVALREFTLDRMLRETEKAYEEALGGGPPSSIA